MDPAQVQALSAVLKQNISKVIVGKEAVIEKVILSLLCGGHILLEDIPGTGKTTLAKALAKSIRCGFKRVQFTPDLLPSDLTGINFFNQKQGEFVFKEGAVFTNILLGDEINRATPRTQSSLLECMEEGQVSVDGVTYSLAKPFLVIATQNPIEIQGTFPLPEAQLDRFFVKLKVGYPDAEDETRMLTGRVSGNPLEELAPVLSGEEIVEAQTAVRGVKVGQAVAGYIIRLAEATRTHEKIKLGVSPRGAIALMRAAQAHAAMDGRDFAIPEDVKAVIADVWCHRLICKGYNLSQSSGAPAEILDQILRQTEAPTEAATL
ncbi:MAG: AAA family ATPase [Candidatus Merdivicinus sp.]|jgi:MoxR-like ATPase